MNCILFSDYLFTATDEYIDSGFLALQQSLDRAFIEQTADQQNVDTFNVNAPQVLLIITSNQTTTPYFAHVFLICNFIATVGTGKIPAERSRTPAICWHQTTNDLHRANLYVHSIVEHDSGANGRGKGLRCQGIPTHCVEQELPEQCHILFHQPGDWLHHLWRDVHCGVFL